MGSEKQRQVLANIGRVTHDGSRHDRRYELDGLNVSQQVRSLLNKGVVKEDDAGGLTKSLDMRRPEPKLKANVVGEIRDLLTAAPPTTRRYPPARASGRRSEASAGDERSREP